MTTAVSEVAIREMLGVQPPFESVPWFNLLIYGDPGAGKTHLCGTAMDHKLTHPMLVLDVEGGTVTLHNRPDVDVIQIRSMDQIVRVHGELVRNEPYYKTVAVDSITELQKLDMRTVMQEQYDKRPDTTDKDVPSQREWGKSGERVRRVVRAFRDLECHVIMTALATEREDEKTKKIITYPSLPGKLRSEIPGFFDVVGYLRAVQERGDGSSSEVVINRIMQVVGTDRVIAKDRTGKLGDLIKNPTIPDMWEIIRPQDSNGKVKTKAKG